MTGKIPEEKLKMPKTLEEALDVLNAQLKALELPELQKDVSKEKIRKTYMSLSLKYKLHPDRWPEEERSKYSELQKKTRNKENLEDREKDELLKYQEREEKFKAISIAYSILTGKIDKKDINLFSAFRAADLEQTKKLLKTVKDINKRESEYELSKAPIHYIVEHACYHHDPGWKKLLEEILLGQNANSSTANHAGNSSMCSNSNVIDINAKYRSSTFGLDTPLSLACTAGNINVVRVLLKSGANPNLCDDQNSIMPLWDILRLSNTDILTEFFKHEAKIEASSCQEKLIIQDIINQYDESIVEILSPHMSSKQKTEVLKSIIPNKKDNRAIEIARLLLEEKTNFYNQEEIKEIRKIHNFDLSSFYKGIPVELRLVELLYKHLIKNYDQGILKGLFNSVIENNDVEGFKRKLKEAKDVGFDFFNIKLEEDYKLNGVVIQKGTSLAEDMLANGRRYSKELIATFLNPTVITQRDVDNFYSKISCKFDLRECNLNFVKLLLDYTSTQGIKIDPRKCESISSSIITNTMKRIMLYDRSDHSQVREDISQIGEVVTSLAQSLDAREAEILNSSFNRQKSSIEEAYATENHELLAELINSNPKKQSPVISPIGLVIIAAGAIVGALAFYFFLAPLILGAGAGIGAKLGLAVAGAVVGAALGAGIGCLTDVRINKYCDNEISQ